MIAATLAAVCRFISGATVQWHCDPNTDVQRIYFGNHSSHLDFIVIWSALPRRLRRFARPVAGRDYWEHGALRRYLAGQVFHAVLIERGHTGTDEAPAAARASIQRMADEMGDRNSLIVFPEGTRSLNGEVGAFKSGLYHLARLRPDTELIPVHLENLNRILPKGEMLPVPMLSRVSVRSVLAHRCLRRQARVPCKGTDSVDSAEGNVMSLLHDTAFLDLIAGVLALLVLASITGWILGRRITSGAGRAAVENINARIHAWWVMALLFVLSAASGTVGSLLLFSLISFLALREFVTLAPTRPGDHRTLFWCFFVVTPLQYYLIWIEWYGLFSVLIPVWVSIFLAIRTALAGDTESFLERSATNQWGMMICVYFVSYAPALLMLPIPGYEHQNAKLMFFLVLVVELSDVLQYVWGKSIEKHPIAPSISPNKTWEGLVGGVVCATAIGTGISWATPFTPVQAAFMAFVLTIMGFAGGLIMSAIKRDRGVKDYGALIEGHGGMLDRIDSLCFAAPVFFHLTRFFYAS